MALKQITPQTIDVINAQIEKALQDIAKFYDISIKTGKSKYTSRNYTVSLEIAVKSEDGEAQTELVTAFKSYRSMYGIIPNLGDTVTLDGVRYEVVGLKASSRKYPVVLKNLANGKRICSTVAYTNQGFKQLA